MTHLFIINPAAKKVRGKIELVKENIVRFFKSHPDLSYDIYVSEWCRDAVSYIRRYITDIRAYSDEIVRVHAIGGTGTLFEVVNGAKGLKNTEIAAHPYGTADAFIRYFGKKSYKYFQSLENVVFGDAFLVDLIRCGSNYGLCFGVTGLEALCDMRGGFFIEKGVPADLSYMISAMSMILGLEEPIKKYCVEIDGKRYDGEYLSFLIANTPCYGKSFVPGPEAHPDDGKLEIYMIKAMSRFSMIRSLPKYVGGHHKKVKEIVHLSGKNIKISTEDDFTWINIDGETFFGDSVEYGIVPAAIPFVCPKGIDIRDLPLIFNRPGSGTKQEGLNSGN